MVQQALQDARVSVVEIQKENEGLVFRLKNSTDRMTELGERIEKFILESEMLPNAEKVSKKIKEILDF